MEFEHPLPAIPVTANDRLVRAARDVVRIKETLDDLCHSYYGSWIVQRLCPQLPNAAGSATVGSAFLAAVLPFVGDKAPEVPGLIDVSVVIGESWSWRAHSPGSQMGEEELQAFLTAPERAYRANKQASLTTYVAPLGLAVAYEGKNRVRFLRNRGVKQMPSAVAIADYPTSDRLRIYHVQTVQGKHAWCVLDDRWLEPLPLPEVTHRMLDPYGVDTGRWPRDWPSVEQVLDAIAEAAKTAFHEPVDLQRLREWKAKAEDLEARSESWSNASIMALDVYRPRWRLVLGGLVGLLAASFVTQHLLAGWRDAASWGLTGLAVGLNVAWCAPLIQARRKHIR